MCLGPTLSERARALFVEHLPCDIETADANNLKRTFKQLALRHHPDKRGQDATELFQAITTTYEELLKNADSSRGEAIQKREINPVAAAAELGQVEEVKEILQQRPWLAREADSLGVDPLMFAASGGIVEIAAVLLGLGADLFARTPFQWTVLVYAALGNHATMVRFLCQQGLSATERELQLAAYTGNPESLHALLELYKGPRVSESGKSLLHFAVDGMCNLKHCVERHVECVNIVLEWQGAVNAVEMKKGRTCLQEYVADPRWHSKALEGSAAHLGVVEQLCAAGANVTGEDWEGSSALSLVKGQGLALVREILFAYT
jgi:ankyrin repeat protein